MHFFDQVQNNNRTSPINRTRNRVGISNVYGGIRYEIILPFEIAG